MGLRGSRPLIGVLQAATSAALLTTGSELIGAVGEHFPKVHTDALTDIGVGLEGLDVRSGEETFQWGGAMAKIPTKGPLIYDFGCA